MKPIRFLLMAAAATLVMASCDDESMNLDKKHIKADANCWLFVDIFGTEVDTTNGCYIQWYNPTFKTKSDKTVLMPSANGLEYEVYLWNGGKAGDTIKLDADIYHDTIVSSYQGGRYSTWLGIDKVEELLGTTVNFEIGVKAKGVPVGGNGFFNQNYYQVCAAVANNSVGGTVEIDGLDGYGNHHPNSATNYYYYRYYLEGKDQKITLYAEANNKDGYDFKRWSDGSTENPRYLTVNGNVWLEAIFGPIGNDDENAHKITIKVNGDGTVRCKIVKEDGATVEIPAEKGSEPNTVVFSNIGYMAKVYLEAEAGNGYSFAGWGDGNTEKYYELELEDDETLTVNFEGLGQTKIGNGIDEANPFNRWFVSNKRNESNATIENGVIKVSIDECQDAWDYKLANVFHELPNQKKGNKFVLSFKVKWEGEKGSAAFRILPDFDLNYEGIGNDKPSDYRITSPSEELIFDNNHTDGWPTSQNNAIGLFQYAGEEWTPITWGGIIGEKGEFIGIQIDLGGYGVPEDFIPNGKGTFMFSEFKVEITETMAGF